MADTLDIRRAVMSCGECKQRFGAEATFCPFDGDQARVCGVGPDAAIRC